MKKSERIKFLEEKVKRLVYGENVARVERF